MTDLAPSPRYFIVLDRKYQALNLTYQVAHCDAIAISGIAKRAILHPPSHPFSFGVIAIETEGSVALPAKALT